MYGNIRVFRVIALLGSLIGTQGLDAGEWGSWRGPSSNGISEEVDVPTRWSDTENVAWRTELPGPSGATPVVWGSQIFFF